MLSIEILPQRLSVCKVEHLAGFDLSAGLCFVAVTDRELSLVCESERVPDSPLAREDGWRAMRVAGSLDFSLTGILSRVSGALAEAGIPIFALSTYDTDYVLVKGECLERAAEALRAAGIEIQS